MTTLHKYEDKRRCAAKISERLRTSPEVRPFPAAVTRLMSACQDPNADNRTFEAIIECDPALSGKLLRMANSPMFCPTGQVKSVAHAVSLLGIRKLRSVAMSVAGHTMFASGDRAQDQRQRLWNHSIGCAVIARSIASRVSGIEQDEAFLAGVFHDVGKLLFYDTIPEDYAKVDGAFRGDLLIQEEEFRFDTTHEWVGLASAEAWDLPTAIRAAIGWHHRPDAADACQEFVRIIHLADELSKYWGIGCDVALDDEQRCPEDALDLTDFVDHLDVIEEESRQSFDETIAATG